MIIPIDNETIILDRTLVNQKGKKTNNSIVTLPESAYQKLSEDTKNNGAVYLTYNDSDLTAGESIPTLDDSLPPV